MDERRRALLERLREIKERPIHSAFELLGSDGFAVSLVVIALIAGVLSSSIGVLVSIKQAVLPPVGHPAWYASLDWKAIGLFVGGTVVAILAFLKLLFETIKSAYDVHDRVVSRRSSDQSSSSDDS